MISENVEVLKSYSAFPPTTDFVVGKGGDLMVNMEVFNTDTAQIDYTRFTSSLGINLGREEEDDQLHENDRFLSLAGQVVTEGTSSKYVFHLTAVETEKLALGIYPYSVLLSTIESPPVKTLLLSGGINVVSQQFAPVVVSTTV